MRGLITLPLIFFSFFTLNLAFSQNGITKKVLFIGNSYTSANNLPQLIADVASSAGDNLNFDSSTPGGAFLVDHFNPVVGYNGIPKIMNGGWDRVVLQDQSLTYTQYIPTYVDAAYRFDTITQNYNDCAQTMFYVTWGRAHGGSFGSYHAMDSVIESNYMAAADSLKFEATPVGAIWRNLRMNHPTIELFASDSSHPTMAGSYAAACGFYSTLFRKDPTQITFNSTLSATDAQIIRNAAKLVVFDSLTKWNVGVYDSLMSIDCLTAELSELSSPDELKLFPNPATDFVKIECAGSKHSEILHFEIRSTIGQLIFEGKVSTGEEIDVRNLRPGVYYLTCKNRSMKAVKFVKT